jgi:hypothetical protein
VDADPGGRQRFDEEPIVRIQIREFGTRDEGDLDTPPVFHDDSSTATIGCFSG